MKKIISVLLVIFLAIFLGGCATSAMPNFINGKYYMAGDSNCARYKTHSTDRIMCLDEDGKEMGYRYSMTNQELQMYQFQEQQAQQQINQFNQGMSQFNQSMQQLNTPKYTNCYKTYSGANCIQY